jgi:ABC-type Mn2+/Zn2+ transport system permease subunit
VSAVAVPLLADGFSRRALLEAVLVGALCGLVGVHVLLRRLAFFTQAMTHATFPGIVLAALAGVNLLAGTAVFGIVLVLAVAWLWSRPRADQTSVVGVVLSAGFALGVALLSAQAGFSKDLSSYLVGSVLTVNRTDIIATGAVLLAVVLVFGAVGKELLLGAFDRGTQVALGYPVRLLDIVLLLVVEATIIAAVPSIGTILSVALIVAPAATARLWADRLAPMTAVAVAVGLFAGLAGLAISQLVNVAAGAAIVLVACACFGVSWLLAPGSGAVARWRVRRRSLAAPPGAATEAVATPRSPGRCRGSPPCG